MKCFHSLAGNGYNCLYLKVRCELHHAYLKRIKKTGKRTWILPGSFLAKTTSQAIVVTKLDDDEIIRLKELCAHMDVIVEKLRQRPLFLYYKP